MGTTESTKPRGWRRWLRRILALILAVPLIAIAGIVFCNMWVVYSSRANVFREISELSENDVALVLGTSKKVAPNRPNLHFQNRLAAAAALYSEGKVKHILVSGDNRTIYYNEPQDMREALLELGVPKEAITRDFAGRRTLDSVGRAERIFGLKKFTIVSDDFHVPRAVFLARSMGLETVALSSKQVDYELSFRSRSREWLARVKAVLDVYVLDTQPTVLGERIDIEIGQAGGS